MWNQDKAKKRVDELIKNSPNIIAQSYTKQYLPLYNERLLRNEKQIIEKPLFDLPLDVAVKVNAVQFYINITNFSEILSSIDGDSERSAKELFKFLHTYYRVFDFIIDNSSAQRVDFHNARLHAAIIESGDENGKQKSILQAIELAQQIRDSIVLAFFFQKIL